MSAPDTSLQAADPARNASVHASAGTGKTWLLVARIIRLLLNGTSADNILAITFTRKAAAEMQQRVNATLHKLMSASDAELDGMLEQYGVAPTQVLRTRARTLYEASLFHPYTLRATTFHAFCQELLQRFPMEAGIPPGFELIETAALQEQGARDALLAETAREPAAAIATALEQLVNGCESLDSTHKALASFLDHRSDWWAYTEGKRDAYAHASEQLATLLGIAPGEDPLGDFPGAQLREKIEAFARLFEKNTTARNQHHPALLHAALDGSLRAIKRFENVKTVVFTKAGAARALKENKTQRGRIGTQGEQQFLALHRDLVCQLEEINGRLACARTLQTNLAWYRAGMRLLEYYQRIKQEQRLLDFSDLEWQACRLLNRSDHASWVQYKLDARIDHLLVDEFQDTNPTQWRLLLPLLEELAAGGEDRARSVFLVGDRKQSIYGFRRADPALFDAASGWLQEHLQAHKYPLDASRRSAQAIIDCVNTVFNNEPLHERISEFNRHSTHHLNLHGRVEILPLAHEEDTADEPAAAELRDPLQTPRSLVLDPAHLHEGRMIAAQIDQLLERGTQVSKDGHVRALGYGDIIILLRRRTHAGKYEQALREAGIPYSSASRGELLENLEVRDLEALLRLLIAPYANLELAQVLRSPLFGLESEQLLPLAGHDDKTWYQRLGALTQPPYPDIYRMLEEWRALTGKIPVHDLIDQIYHQAEVVERYRAAFPPQLRGRVEASLTRFIELALELDNGRYPSLPYFLDRLSRLRQAARDQPDEGTPDDADAQRVRLLTIHGAKGLEAPVIFLADAAAHMNDRSAHAALVNWPPGAQAPENFLLLGNKDNLDPVSRTLLEQRQQQARREDANLLYVAMTRARQYLFISGSLGKKNHKEPHWYEMIHDATSAWEKTDTGRPYLESGAPPAAAQERAGKHTAAVADARLSKPIPPLPVLETRVAPSRTRRHSASLDQDVDARERGIAIHTMLEWLTEETAGADLEMPAPLAHRLGRAAENPELQTWWQEALTTVQNPALSPLFDRKSYLQAMNEVPVQYLDGERLVHGIIDRVVLRENRVLVIDYKTHRASGREQLRALAEDYREQMRLYGKAAALLWPQHRIEPQLLFTHSATLIPSGDLPDSRA